MKNITKWKTTIVLFLIFSFILLPTIGYCQIQSEKITIEKIEKLSANKTLWKNSVSTTKTANKIKTIINTYVKNSNNIQIQQFMNDLIKMEVRGLILALPNSYPAYPGLASFAIAIRNNFKLKHEYQKKLLESVSKNRKIFDAWVLLETVGLMNHWYYNSYPSKKDQKIYLNLLEDPKSQSMMRATSAMFLRNIPNSNLKMKIKDIVSNLLKSYKKQLKEAETNAHKTGKPFVYPPNIMGIGRLEAAMEGLKNGIFYEVEVNNVARVKELLAKNPKLVNIKNKNGQTPLFFATNINIAKLLLSYGADINAKDNNGQTPLSYAVLFDHIGNVKLFLLHHADVNIEINGESLLHYAEEKKYNSIVDLLRQYGSKE